MYIFIFAIGLFFSLFKDLGNRKLYLYTGGLLALALFRYGVGADYFAYQYLFERLHSSVIDELKYNLDNQEFLFRLVGSVLKGIGFSYQEYLMVFSTINLIFVCKICKKYSLKPVMSMFLYYCFFYFVWTFSGIRQGVTLVIGMYYFLKCLEEKSTKKMILVSILLSFIHASALILIILYFLNQFSLNKKKLVFISAFSLVIAVLPINKLIILIENLPILNRMLPYITVEYSLFNIFTFSSIARIGFMFIGLLYYDLYTNKSKIHKVTMDTYLISLDIYFIMKFSEITAARLSIYGFYLSIIILTNIYCIYKDKLNKLIFMIVLLVLSSMYFYKEIQAMERQGGLVHSNSIITPYTNIFNKDGGYYFMNRFN